jgi:hypothetical protein
MTGKCYYMTTLAAWRRQASRFANSHWLALNDTASSGDATPRPDRSRQRRASRARRRYRIQSATASARAKTHFRRDHLRSIGRTICRRAAQMRARMEGTNGKGILVREIEPSPANQTSSRAASMTRTPGSRRPSPKNSAAASRPSARSATTPGRPRAAASKQWLARIRATGDVERPDHCACSQLISHDMPNRSTSTPKRWAQNVVCSGIWTVPLSDSA